MLSNTDMANILEKQYFYTSITLQYCINNTISSHFQTNFRNGNMHNFHVQKCYDQQQMSMHTILLISSHFKATPKDSSHYDDTLQLQVKTDEIFVKKTMVFIH